jgi:tight adherence protein B
VTARRLRNTLFTVGLAVTVLGPPSALAADEPALGVTAVDVSKYPDVSFVVEVPPELAGTEFPPDSWTLTEDRDARRASVRSVLNDALRVVLVLDTSGSMHGSSLDAAKGAAVSFVERLPTGAEVAVVAFGSRPSVLHALSTDRVGAITAVRALRASGETALYDAVVVATQQVPRDGRRTEIVVLSDGGDTASAAGLDRAVESVAASGARVHAVALETAESNRAPLEALAHVAGGGVAAASDPAGLSAVYDQLATRFVHRYEVSYNTAAHGATPVAIATAAGGVSAGVDFWIELPDAALAPPTPRPTPVGAARLIPLALGAGLVFAGFTTLLLLLFVPAAPRALLAGAARQLAHRGHLADLSDRATLVAQAVLDRGPAKGLAAALENAGIMLRPAEFVVTVCFVAIGSGVAGLAAGGPIVAIVLVALVAFGARLYVGNRESKRRSRFGKQLADTLQQLTSALRAGHGLLQALAVIAREAESPTNDEFRRLMTEVRLGRDLTEALHAMATRVACEDFDWVVQAIEVQRDVGGDLVEVIDIVAATIRQRQQLQRQVKALSAEGRFSAYVLLALPFGVAMLMFLTNRAYLMQLFRGPGLALLGTGVVLMLAGTIWLKKLIRLEL